MTIHLEERHAATILAALHYFQNDMDDGECLSPDVDPNGELTDIATNNGKFKQLTAIEIDGLREVLNP